MKIGLLKGKKIFKYVNTHGNRLPRYIDLPKETNEIIDLMYGAVIFVDAIRYERTNKTFLGVPLYRKVGDV